MNAAVMSTVLKITGAVKTDVRLSAWNRGFPTEVCNIGLFSGAFL